MRYKQLFFVLMSNFLFITKKNQNTRCIVYISLILFLFNMVRIKNRYVVVQIIPHNTQTKVLHLKDHVLSKCIMSHVQKFYGVYGAGLLEHGFRVKYCNERTKIAILRSSHYSHKYVTSILPLITVIGETRAKFRTIYTGATIMQCNKFIIKHQQKFLDCMVGQIESAKERQDMIKRVLEFEIN
ncbi:ribonuclease P/MRP protein subunit POP5 [Lucilia cuprina]|uniref:ribonuclease P/MRP protein subunit POP5 n=1 Tax=Lucilia cuprina TaxID=7375 RepID=UPI001F05971B|nr:ribonuclease P/MRP protein subunit POP5 [Lucilia cuprina]